MKDSKRTAVITFRNDAETKIMLDKIADDMLTIAKGVETAEQYGHFCS